MGGTVTLLFQIRMLAAALVGGFCMAFLYDIYWLLCAGKRRPLPLGYLLDMLFCCTVFCAFVPFWFYTTGGAIRLAVYLWLAWGALAWRFTLSRPFRNLRRRR